MKYLFIDLETTGLNPQTDHVLEIGWCLTDDKFRSITDVRSEIVTTSRFELEGMPDEVVRMHTESSLLNDMFDGETLLIDDIADMILMDITGLEGPIVVAGFSVHFDLNFIRVWMPRLAKQLSHRIIDVSTLRMFFGGVTDYVPVVTNSRKHRAAYDVAESLEVARSYRNYVEKNNA